MIRICRRLSIYPDESLYEAIHKACLSKFLPSLARNTLVLMLAKAGIEPPPRRAALSEIADALDDEHAAPEENLTVRVEGDMLYIGDVAERIRPPSNPLLVPDIVFHENPRQTRILREMLKDYQLGACP